MTTGEPPDGSEALTFYGSEALTLHGSEAQYKCKDCDYVASKMYHLLQHQQMHTKPAAFMCKMCHQSYPFKIQLDNHVRFKHTGQGHLECDICSKKYTSQTGLKMHKQSVHENRFNYECKVCARKFMHLHHFKGHVSSHYDVKQEICSKCGKSFRFSQDLSRHVKICPGKT